MTEQQWASCTDPTPMLVFLRGKAKDRKLRLFAVACCRRIWHLLIDERSRKGVETAESYLEGQATIEEMTQAAEEAHAAQGTPSEHGQAGLKVSAWYAARSASGTAYWSPTRNTGRQDAEIVAWSCGAAAATAHFFWDDPTWDRALYAAYTGVGYEVGDWGDVCWSEAPWEMGWDSFLQFPDWATERLSQAALLRCIFGPLRFRRIPFDPQWLTGTVVKLAQAIHDERAFDRLPILADALEDAGCTNADILKHCRQPGEHSRGCWVVDALLGKK
jgi:hypothetical protein